MKVIDLLNKIANGEEMPRIKYKDEIYYYTSYQIDEEYVLKGYRNIDSGWLNIWQDNLNDEVEIIEEGMCHKCHKYPAEYNQTYCEFCLGISKEEKKIPEKLIPTSLKGIDNLDEKIEIAHIDTVSAINKINEVIDYLKSKGE